MLYKNSTFENYVPTCREAENLVKELKQWVIDFNQGSKRNLILCGKVGTGKTHLAHAILKEVKTEKMEKLKEAFDDQFARKVCVDMFRFNELHGKIKNTYGKKSFSESEMTAGQIKERVYNLELLILDDVGAAGFSEADAVLLEDIMLERNVRQLPTVISTNLTKTQLRNVIGERSSSRMRHGGLLICSFIWDDFRNKGVIEV